MLDILGADHPADVGVERTERLDLGLGQLIELDRYHGAVPILSDDHPVKHSHGGAFDQIGQGRSDLAPEVVLQESRR